MSRVAALLVVAALSSAAPARAEVVRHRLQLPAPGSAIDVAGLAADDEGPVRIVLAGTVTSSIDGVEYDPVGRRRVDGGGPDGEGPYVALPPGSRVVEHRSGDRYVVEVPRAPTMPVALQVEPLARRYLVTLSEAAASLSGGVEVQVLGAAPAPAAVATARLDKGLESLPPQAAATTLGGALVVALAGLLGTVILRRGRRRRRLIRRIRSSAHGVAAEARSLGPTFDHVSASSEKLILAAGTAERHLLQARAALRRTRRHRSGAAERKRQSLHRQEAEALGRLAGIADHLEATRVALASHAVGRDGDVPLGTALTALDVEVRTALEAEAEARAVS